MPAFGATIADFSALRAIGCVLVDTTCGSVLNVWKRVESYARDGFTSLIHGKYYHERDARDGVAGQQIRRRAFHHRARHG
jgi:4-hydroxy-3-methylbut-2-enyl diphosphate reductase IspH